eukprot:4547386-Alexandrium_andersonii.AAC.1
MLVHHHCCCRRDSGALRVQRALGARAVGAKSHVQAAQLHVRMSSAPTMLFRAPTAEHPARSPP